MRRPLSVISVCVQSFVNKIRCLFPSCPIKPGMTRSEGSVAKELSISDRLPTKNRFFTAFRMTTFGFSGGPARAPLVLGPFAETKEPRRAGTTPRKTKAKILDPRSRPVLDVLNRGSGMTEGWMPDQAGHDGRRCGRAILWRFLPCGLPVIFCTVCKVLYNLYNLYNAYMLYVLYNFSHCFKRLPFSIFWRTPARNFLCLLSAVVLGLFFST